MFTIARPTASASPSLEIVNWNHKKKVLKGFDWRTKTERLGSLDSLTNSYCPCMKTARWLFDNFQMTACKLPEDCLINVWQLPDNYMTNIWHLHEKSLTFPWQLSDSCQEATNKTNATQFQLADDYLKMATGWSLSYTCLTTAWKLPNDYLMTARDCLMTAWWLPDDCLMTARQLPDKCLTNVWLMRNYLWSPIEGQKSK